jgi:putative transposase
MSREDKEAAVKKDNSQLSIARRCKLLGVSRSTLYYKKAEINDNDLELMKMIDMQYTKYPFYGSRRMMRWLRKQGRKVNRKHIRRLMRLMGLEGLAPKPNTSKPRKEHKKYPYLLKGLKIDRANQVWATDITYVPMRRGFIYLVAIIDWYSRHVLSWRISNTLDSDFCVDALEDALRRYGKPEIFNSDQGCQFTSNDFIEVLENNNIQISMDGKSRWVDNVLVERLWRSLKYEEIYPSCYETVFEAKAGISAYLNFFNNERLHQALDYKTPAEIYRNSLRSITTETNNTTDLNNLIKIDLKKEEELMVG